MNKLTSILYPFRGLIDTLKNKTIWKFIYIPLLINIAISVILYSVIFSQLSDITATITESIKAIVLMPKPDTILGKWIGFLIGSLNSVVKIFLFAILFILYPYILAILSGLITPVFRTKLFEVVMQLSGWKGSSVNSQNTVMSTITGIISEFTKIGYFLMISLLTMFLNFIPGLGVVIQIFITAFYIGWEFFTPYMENNGMDFSKQKKFARQNTISLIGFGIAAWMLLLIPGLQALFLTTHTVGAARMAAKWNEDKKWA